jgi:hypothetical protein
MALTRTGLYVKRSVGGLFAVEDMATSTGARIFVHAGTGTDAAGYGTGPDKPVATLDYAIGLCTASKGDIVYLMPGHAEALIAAATLTMDVISVQVIGLGTGRLRPQISITTATTATWNVTAANCLIKNVDIVSNFLNIAAAMTVGADADGLTLDGVNFYDTSVILGSLIGISVAAGVTDITIKNCRYNGLALTAPATDCILCAGAVDRLSINNCYFKGDFSGGVLTATAAKSIDLLLTDIIEINMSETGKGINLKSDTTGAAHNVMAYLEDHAGNEKAITGAALFMTDRVLQTNVVTASPFLCIAVDT